MHSNQIKFALVLMIVAIPFAVAQIKLPPAASKKVDYKQDIQPLLSQNCYSCHGPEVQQAGLRLDLRQNALRGGDYGPVIKIGNSAASKLIHRLVEGCWRLNRAASRRRLRTDRQFTVAHQQGRRYER